MFFVVCFIVFSLLDFFCIHFVIFIEVEVVIIIIASVKFGLIWVDLPPICSSHCLTHSSWTMGANIGHGTWSFHMWLDELSLPNLTMSCFCLQYFHWRFSYTTYARVDSRLEKCCNFFDRFWPCSRLTITCQRFVWLRHCETGITRIIEMPLIVDRENLTLWPQWLNADWLIRSIVTLVHFNIIVITRIRFETLLLLKLCHY